MREIKACIFDLDGVICDTAKYHYLAWKQLADRLGIPFTEADNERLKGVSRIDSLRILVSLGGREYGEEELADLAEEKNAVYVDYISGMKSDEVLPGVLEFLTYCREQGIRTALGSVSKNAPLILENLGLAPYFDVIIDGNSVKRAKPDPEVFLKGAAGNGVEPGFCAVFEDARSGIEAAKAAGMTAVGIGDTGTLSEADFVIRGFDAMEPEALLKRIGSL